MKSRKKMVQISAVVLVFLVAIMAGVGMNFLRLALSDGTGIRLPWGKVWKEGTTILMNPRAGFPNQNQIEIVCMGIDDNWTNKDEVFTGNSRTDTLFLLTLNLANGSASMLSIPRDSYTHIAGTNYSDKINSAYATGGPQRTLATVADLTGVSTPYYLVLNINATKTMVNALGGVDLNVEHAMRYDDNWGHLHINLHPGFQHLNGSQAVGFARYRHPNPGMPPTPEDGDIRRTYRQHVLLRAMIAKAKTFGNLTQMNHLIDVGMSEIRTNLTREQLFDLAMLYRHIQPNDIQTATLPGKSFVASDGQWDYKLDPVAMKAYIAWLVNNNPTPIEHWTTIIVKNGTSTPGLAETVVRRLQTEGYTNVYNGGNAPASPVMLTSAAGQQGMPRTAILDTGVPDPQVPALLAQDLGVPATVTRQKVPPNHLGWSPPPTVTISLGQDYAALAKNASNTVTPSSSAVN